VSNTVGERVGKSQDTAEKDAEAEGERQTQVAIAEIETQARREAAGNKNGQR